MDPLIGWALVAWWAAAVVVFLFTTGVALVHPVIRARGATVSEQPPVSIIVPLSGIDPELEDNLHALFRQDYPEFEILFSVADPGDPAKALAERIAAEHPTIPSTMIVGASDRSENPKTNNVVKPLERAAHDLVLMTDSNVASRPDRLARLVRHMDKDCGIVSSTAFGVRPESFWGELECAVLNPYHARYLLTADLAGFGWALGKTMLFRRSDMDKGGGIERLAAGSAEDAALTRIMRSQGLAVVFAEHPVDHPIGARRFRSFWNRHLRWFIYRRQYAWPSYVLETAGGALVATIVGAIGWYGLYGVSPAIFVPVGVAAWFVVEAVYLTIAKGHLNWKTPMVNLVREVVIPAIWWASLLRWSPTWKSR